MIFACVWLRTSVHSLLAACLLLSGFGALAADSPATELRIATTDSQKMYVPLVEAVVRDAGLTPVVTIYPSARSTLEFAAGRADAEMFRIAAALDANYPPDVIKIGPLLKARWGLFVKAGSHLKTASRAELLQRQIGYVRGTLVPELFIQENHLNAAATSTRESALNMLYAGRFEVLMDNERLILATQIEKGLTGKFYLADVIREDQSYLLLHPQARSYEPALRAAFERWTSSGRWQREFMAINKAHGLPPEMGIIQALPRK